MNQLYTAILLVLHVLLVSTSVAQNEHAEVIKHEEVIRDEKIDLLVEKHIFLNRHNYALAGWRIQIFFDAGANSKKKASDILNQFTIRYPETQAYLSFKEPYYRVRVGDFRSRLEAEGFLRKIQAEYPNAFPTNDFINPPPLE